VRVLGVPREFLAQAHPDAILSSLGLDGPGVALSVRQELAAAGSSPIALRTPSVAPSPPTTEPGGVAGAAQSLLAPCARTKSLTA